MPASRSSPTPRRDLDPGRRAARGHRGRPAHRQLRRRDVPAGVDLSTDEFWERMTAPDAPFPTTAAVAPGDFKTAYEAAFDERRRRHRLASMSRATCRARSRRPGRAADCCPTARSTSSTRRTASMGEGMLAQIGAELAARRRVGGRDRARSSSERAADMRSTSRLDTLEYLKRGGRISGARAAVGTMLSVKPIITVENGDRGERRPRPDAGEGARAGPRAADRAAARAAAILHTTDADVEEFRDEVIRRSASTASKVLTIDSSGRRSGRTSARAASARSCSTSLRPRGRAAPSSRGPVTLGPAGCGHGCANGDATVDTCGPERADPPAILRPRHDAPPPTSPHRRATRPVGSSGRRPRSTGRRHAARHRGPSFHDDRARRGRRSTRGTSPSSSSTSPPSA